MKRLWIVLILAIILTGTSIIGILTVDSKNSIMAEYVNLAEKAAISGDYKKAAELSKKAEEEWIVSERILSIFIDHSDLSDIGLSASKLMPLIENADIAGFRAECQVIRVQLIHIKNDEIESSSIL